MFVGEQPGNEEDLAGQPFPRRSCATTRRGGWRRGASWTTWRRWRRSWARP